MGGKGVERHNAVLDILYLPLATLVLGDRTGFGPCVPVHHASKLTRRADRSIVLAFITMFAVRPRIRKKEKHLFLAYLYGGYDVFEETSN